MNSTATIENTGTATLPETTETVIKRHEQIDIKTETITTQFSFGTTVVVVTSMGDADTGHWVEMVRTSR